MSQGQQNTNYAISGSTKFSPIFTGDYAAADEGSYFVSTLAATASTAVANTTQALADTNPALGIFNGQSTGGYNIYLRYIKVKVTVVGGTNTSTALGTPQSVNTGSSVLSKMSGYGGVNIAAAQTANGRRVGDGQVTGA